MSNRRKSLLVNRVLVAIFACLAIALLLTSRAIPNTNARLRQEHDIFYYTDATFTVQCGYYVFPCSGSVHQSGCVTPYYEEDWYDCYAGDGIK